MPLSSSPEGQTTTSIFRKPVAPTPKPVVASGPVHAPERRTYESNQGRQAGTNMDENPHTLWKQLLGLGIAAIALILVAGVAGVFVVVTGIFAFADAWSAGIYKKPGAKSFVNVSPMGWGIAMMGLLIIAYPLYGLSRNELRTKQGNRTCWVLTNVFAVIGLIISLGVAVQGILGRVIGS